jgi:hypothetical protein
MSRRAGRKRKAEPITLPALASVPVADRPKLARARLQAVANPQHFDVRHNAGALLVEQKLAPQMRPDDRLTPERRRQAEDADLLVTMDTFTTEAGERTQLKRQRLVSPLERLWKAGVLDADQYGAARRYQSDFERAVMSGPRMSVKYEARLISGIGQPFLMGVEAQQDHQRRVEAARLACGDKLGKMLDWIAIEPMGWRNQAREWWPAKSEQACRVEFKRLLRLACEALLQNYRQR